MLRFNQAGFLVRWQIDLRDVTGNDRLTAVAEAGEEHKHLLGSRILRLIENDEGVVERAPAHVRERGNFNDAALPVFLDVLSGHHVMERRMRLPSRCLCSSPASATAV